MRIPKSIKQRVQAHLWRKADALGWHGMTVIERARQYALWVEDSDVGTVLAHYIDPRKVHSYIKDTLMKPYSRASMSSVDVALSAMGLGGQSIAELFERPHGVLLTTGKIICWGKADDWKLVLLAVHERAFLRKMKPFGAVLLPPLTRFLMPEARHVVEDAATKLGIETLAWHDPVRRMNGTPDEDTVLEKPAA